MGCRRAFFFLTFVVRNDEFQGTPCPFRIVACMARSGRKAKRQHLQLKNPHQQWSDKCMHKCQCHQSNMTPSASNLRPKYPAHGCCCLFGSSRGFAELQKKSKIGKNLYVPGQEVPSGYWQLYFSYIATQCL